MKATIKFFLLLFCFTCLRAQGQSFEIDGVKMSDTINKTTFRNEKVGIWLLRGHHMPNSGYPLQQIIETGMYVNNRKEGLWIYYHKNGKLRSKLTYVNGVLNGPAAFYDEKEKILKEGAFKDNKWVQ